MPDYYDPYMDDFPGNDLPSQGGITGTQYGQGMDNKLLELLRLHNVFGPTEPIGGQQPTPPSPDVMFPTQPTVPGPRPQGFDPMQILQMYKPEHQMTDEMTRMINSMPQRNHPGFGRKLLATFAGMGGPQSADYAMYAPYYREMADWKAKFDPVTKAATEERYMNANERQLLANMASSQASDARLLATLRGQDINANLGQQRVDLGKDALKQKIKYQDAITLVRQEQARGGQFVVEDATGDGYIVYKDGSKKKVEGLDEWSLAEKDKLKRETAIATAEATTKAREGAKKHRIVQGKFQDPNDPSKTIEGTIDLDAPEEGIRPLVVGAPVTPKVPAGETPKPETRPVALAPKPAGATAREESAANRNLDTIARANAFMAANPKLRGYITINPKTKTVDITTPGIISGPSNADYQRMQAAINPPKGTAIPPPPRQEGKKHVRVKAHPEQTGWVTNPDPNKYEVIP